MDKWRTQIVDIQDVKGLFTLNHKRSSVKLKQECAEEGNKDKQQVRSDGLKKQSFRKVEGDRIPTVSQPEKPHQWGASLRPPQKHFISSSCWHFQELE